MLSTIKKKSVRVKLSVRMKKINQWITGTGYLNQSLPYTVLNGKYDFTYLNSAL